MTVTHVRVRVGSEMYALPVDHVEEVAELGPLTPVPGAMDGVLGVYNLRGEILPVYELSKILGIKRSGSRFRLVVTEVGGRRVGLAVDDVNDVTELPLPTEPTESRLLLGAALCDEELVGFVDVDALFMALRDRAAV